MGLRGWPPCLRRLHDGVALVQHDPIQLESCYLGLNILHKRLTYRCLWRNEHNLHVKWWWLALESYPTPGVCMAAPLHYISCRNKRLGAITIVTPLDAANAGNMNNILLPPPVRMMLKILGLPPTISSNTQRFPPTPDTGCREMWRWGRTCAAWLRPNPSPSSVDTAAPASAPAPAGVHFPFYSLFYFFNGTWGLCCILGERNDNADTWPVDAIVGDKLYTAMGLLLPRRVDNIILTLFSASLQIILVLVSWIFNSSIPGTPYLSP